MTSDDFDRGTKAEADPAPPGSGQPGATQAEPTQAESGRATSGRPVWPYADQAPQDEPPGQWPRYGNYGQAGTSFESAQYGPSPHPPAGPDPQQYGPNGPQPGRPGYDRRNPAAIAALVCGCVQVLLFWIIFLWPLLAAAAIVLGGVALRQIHRRGGRGGGMAVAGIVLGSVGLLFFLTAAGILVRGTGTG